jgi:hypothetical protein
MRSSVAAAYYRCRDYGTSRFECRYESFSRLRMRQAHALFLAAVRVVTRPRLAAFVAAAA